MKFNDKLSLFYRDPFSFVDNLNLRFKRFDFNIFAKYQWLRKTVMGVVIISLFGWVLMGFDSTPLQIMNPLMEVVMGQQAVISKQLGYANMSAWNFFWTRYNYYYGKENHWSAWVIYGLAYYFLSKHFDKFGIHKSKNVCYSAAVTGLTVACFEFYWMYSFAFFQNQPWVVTWAMPQLRILLQNLMFMVGGIVGILYMWADSYVLNGKEIVGRNYCFRWNWISLGLIGLSVGLAVLWWFYPLPIQHIPPIQLSNGQFWTNTNYFPQTLYTVKTDVSNPINAGEWFYVPNNLVHGLNTLVKVVWTLTILYIARVKSLNKYKHNIGGV